MKRNDIAKWIKKNSIKIEKPIYTEEDAFSIQVL